MVRRALPHPFRWIGLFTPTAILCLAFLAFLTPTDALVWPSGIVGTTYRGDTPIGRVALQRRDGRWVGDVADFPIGTATHFAPDTYHGFFVVHLADGRLLALSDRSGHQGQRVYWNDLSLKTYRIRGDGFVDRAYGTLYGADGRVLGGPAPRPLDPYPTEIVGDRLLIDSSAYCPPNQPGWQTWCREPQP